MTTPNNPNNAKLSYTPSNELESKIYNYLWVTATGGQQQLAGAAAVQFLSKSKLEQQQLKQIWSLSAAGSNVLDEERFRVAVRLIALFQNKVKGEGLTLKVHSNSSSLQPPYFEGISYASLQQQVPLPSPAPSVNVVNTGGGGGALVVDPFAINPSDIQSYKGIFASQPLNNNKLGGREAVELFMKSGLSQPELRQIWVLADQDKDNLLSEMEFVVAMHLIVCIRHRGATVPPQALPQSLASLLGGSTLPSVPAPTPAPAPVPTMPPAPEQQTSIPPMTVPNPMSAAPSLPSPTSLAATPMPASNGFGNNMNTAQPPSLVAPQQQQVGSFAAQDKFSAFDDLSVTSNQQCSVSMPQQTDVPTVVKTVPPITVTLTRSNDEQSVSNQFNSNNSVTQEQKPLSLPTATRINDNGKTEELNRIIQKLKAENISLKAKLTNMLGEESEVDETLDIKMKELNALSSETDDLRRKLLSTLERLGEKKAEVNKVTAEIKGLEAQKSDLARMNAEIDDIAKKVEENESNNQVESYDFFDSDPVVTTIPASAVPPIPTPAPSTTEPAPTLTTPLEAASANPFHSSQITAPSPTQAASLEPQNPFEAQAVAEFPPAPPARTIDFILPDPIEHQPTPAPVIFDPPVLQESVPPPAPVVPQGPSDYELSQIAYYKEQVQSAENTLENLRKEHGDKGAAMNNQKLIAEDLQSKIAALENAKKGRFSGKSKKKKELADLSSKFEIEAQKLYDAQHQAALSEKSVQDAQANLEKVSIELAEYESMLDQKNNDAVQPVPAIAPTHNRSNTFDQMGNNLFEFYGGQVMGEVETSQAVNNDNPFAGGW